MMPAPVELKQISKRFGQAQALSPLDLHVEGGQLLALLGPSGCGKTTTLRILAGFETPDTGSVHIDQRDVTDLPPNKRGLGMVFQNYSLFPHMTVGENIAFGLKMRRVNRSEQARRVREMLDLVRLSGYEDRHIHQLSGGQQQRIALARALITNPSVLLLDEPLGALDKNLREGMQFELRALQQRLGITSVMVTHDQEEAVTMSDRVAVMAQGRIVQIGAPQDVYARPLTRFVSEFLGTSNIFEGVLASDDSGRPAVRLDDAPQRLMPAAPAAALPAPGARVQVAVRPERIRLAANDGGALSARVQAVIFRGSHYAYEMSVAGRAAPVFVYHQDHRPVAGVGERVGLAWDEASAVILDEVAA
ncbi:ABC transporter ATP-binding protein [Achromobacter aloeverae]|uniref:Spermidine/putrescine import ATP-binding protein PotA n=1 Tax=Achromobacter aloeverae TaxID=1750518 RepID=A0A4Q1HN26_9BURK|nr:ABC transporter ATP-binding protein [Achromobacter aloeverae]RXN92378.1 Fe3+/spermidine/putrescine ABC transporter ATP-binding protein [Achromobacter aloeverae]